MASPTNQVGFILLWGYCQATSRFFQPDQFHQSDIDVICKLHGIAIETIELRAYRQRTFNYHKQIIRQYLKLQPFNDDAKAFFLQAIQDRVVRHQLPKQIIQDVKELLKSKHIEVPSYNRFALVITQAISNFEKDLIQVIANELSSTQQADLNALLDTHESTVSTVTQLKTISHSRKPKAIKESIQAFQLVQELYQKMLPVINSLNLHADTIKYYANWVRKASLYQVIQLQPNKRYLYLLCFILHQYQLRQDILADIRVSGRFARKYTLRRIY